MSDQWMIKILVSLGFTKMDAQVYIYLVTEGIKKARDIADNLLVSKGKLYHILKKLQGIGIVKASLEYPTRFAAVPFEKALNILIENSMKQKQSLIKSKDQLLAAWKEILKNSEKKDVSS